MSQDRVSVPVAGGARGDDPLVAGVLPGCIFGVIQFNELK